MASPIKSAAAAAVAALMLVGCSSPAPVASPSAAPGSAQTPASAPPTSTPPVKVSIAIQPWLGYGAWYIAQDQGYFAANNLQVELVDFEADADMLAALAAGKVDALNVASHGALQMVEQGVDAKIVLLEDASTTADAILTDGSITDVAGLKGKKVSYEEGTTSDLLLNYALSTKGLTIADITKVPLGAAEAGAALIAGQVPAAVTYEPYINQATSKKASVKVIYTAGEKEGLISDVLMVGSKLAKSDPATVTALIKSWGQAVDFYNANPDKGRAIIAAGVGEKPEDLTTAFDGVHLFSLADNKTQLAGPYVTSTLPTVKDVAVKSGLLKGTADPAAIVDASFLPA